MADDLDFSNLAKLPDGSLTQAEVRLLLSVVDGLRSENDALRALVARFYTQAWEDPLTDDEMALLDPIVRNALEADRG